MLPLIVIIRSSFRYRSSNSSQKEKKDATGRQSSSKIITSSTAEKTQSIPLDIRRPQPRFLSEKFLKTSHSQSILPKTARACRHFCASSGKRGPSATTKSFLGLTLAIESNTICVRSGRLKIRKATGVESGITSNETWCWPVFGQTPGLSDHQV